MKNTHLSDNWCVILCGGRGSRLGSITKKTPKPLVTVYGRPILWYSLLNLHKVGFRKFLLPLGYKGKMIKNFLKEHIDIDDIHIETINAGIDTSISSRISQSLVRIDSEDFFLLNGDTLFDFDINTMYRHHINSLAEATLASTDIISTFGLLIESGDRVINFTRENKVSNFVLSETLEQNAYINAGFSWINTASIRNIELDENVEFETEYYGRLAKERKLHRYHIEGLWFPIDTQKDLQNIHSKSKAHSTTIRETKKMKKDLTARYSQKVMPTQPRSVRQKK